MKPNADILSKKQAILSFVSESNNPTLINKLKEVVDNFRSTQEDDMVIPEWQKEEVRRKIDNYTANPKSAMSFEDFMNELETKYAV